MASSSKFWFAEGERTVKLQLKLRKMIGTDQKQKFKNTSLLISCNFFVHLPKGHRYLHRGGDGQTRGHCEGFQSREVT